VEGGLGGPRNHVLDVGLGLVFVFVSLFQFTVLRFLL